MSDDIFIYLFILYLICTSCENRFFFSFLLSSNDDFSENLHLKSAYIIYYISIYEYMVGKKYLHIHNNVKRIVTSATAEYRLISGTCADYTRTIPLSSLFSLFRFQFVYVCYFAVNPTKAHPV